MQLVDSQYQLPLETRQWGQLSNGETTASQPKRPHPSAFSLCRPQPQPQPSELAQLSKYSRHLENQIAEAKQEQDLMLDFFNQMLQAEQGKQPAAKKGKRRTIEDAYERFECPRCARFYTSDSSLKRHIRLKHDEFGDDPPQKYHTLHPEPDLGMKGESSLEYNNFEEEGQGLQERWDKEECKQAEQE